MKKSDKKTAFITGGSRGIGFSVAEKLAKMGVSVAIAARDAAEVKAACKKIGSAAFPIVCDVASEKKVKSAIARAIHYLGHIDIAVNCAGIQAPIGSFVSCDMGEWENNIRVNLLGTAHVCYEVIPHMVRRKSGRIINFSGGGATSSRPNFSAYAVAKTGVVRLTEVLADEMRGKNVFINAIAPGAVNTSMLAEVLRSHGKAGAKERREALQRKREGGTSPELASDLVAHLALSNGPQISGKLISAVWDNWKEWSAKDIKEISSGDALTIRRIKFK